MGYVGGTTGTVGYNGNPYTITASRAVNTGTTFLTLSSVSGIAINDNIYLTGLTAATWLNTYVISVSTIIGNVISFTDPTGGHTQALTADTGTALDTTGFTNTLTIPYSSTSGNYLYMALGLANYADAPASVVDSNGNNWSIISNGASQAFALYLMNAAPITFVTIDFPLAYPASVVLGEYSSVNDILQTFGSNGLASPASLSETIGGEDYLIANTLVQTVSLPSVTHNTGTIRNTATQFFDKTRGYISVSLIDNTTVSVGAVTVAANFTPTPALVWEIIALDAVQVSTNWFVTPGSQSLVAGQSNGFVGTVTAGFFSGTVTPVVVTPTLPFGMTVVFTPTTIPGTGGVTNVEVTTTTSTPPGTYTIELSASDGTNSSSVVVMVEVRDYELTVAPSSVSLLPTQIAFFDVTVTSYNGYNGNVTLTCSGQPSGVNVSFTPPIIPLGSGISVMNIIATNVAAPGLYTLTITGTDGTNTRTVTCSLIIDATGWARRWTSI